MENEMTPKEQLESLKGYLEHLAGKYDRPHNWSQMSQTKQEFSKVQMNMADKEMKRVSKRIRELAHCKRHAGIHGLDCFLCKLEAKF